MKTAQKVFKEFISDPENEAWFNTRPKSIQDLIRKLPYETFIIKDGAPYGISCPGQKVHLYSYVERPEVPNKPLIKVIVLASEKIQAAKDHEVYLYKKHNIESRGETIEQIHEKDVIVEVDPVWLDPAE